MHEFSQQWARVARVVVAGLFAAGSALAQNVVHIDATAPVPAPEPVLAKLGDARNPKGDVIGVNSQYLTFNGKPWLPVMGEFHFSRTPAEEWEPEILKMKAAGVQIISTYVIWIHQEQVEGVYDWSGQRDLRRFVQLCAKHGMYVYPRIGPWVHAEVRNGGLPDWVLKNGPTRQNDPVYLREVDSYYRQIDAQLAGLLWKDGGPVIGVQIDNEYRDRGPGRGDEHIRTLKRMAVDAGLDVPLYTATAWDNAAAPLDAVLPVFGGYPDAPWEGSPKQLPTAELYAFRFRNRSAGNMGAIGGQGQGPASAYKGTPFLTGEVGDGIEDTYIRRPVVSTDDVAAIDPVMLGSGVNLLGYYMFHGGRNPEGGAETLQESQRTGYPTDVPVRSYDFQAPLGEFGEERESLRKLKLVHYFLADFGAELAPMTPRTPDVAPSSPSDASVARVDARTSGDRGFIFFSNYVRHLAMPERRGFQVELRLPAGPVLVPRRPMTLPSGAYGIWPVNLPLGNSVLEYSTAQIFKRVSRPRESTFFFFAIPGVPAEMLFGKGTRMGASTGGVTPEQTASGLLVRVAPETVADFRLGDGTRIVVLPERQAEDVWRTDDAAVLLETGVTAFADGRRWTLESEGDPRFAFGVFGEDEPPTAVGTTIRAEPGRGVFHRYAATLPEVRLRANVTATAPAGPRPPWKMGAAFSWRPEPIAMAPDDADFEKAAAWRIELPAHKEQSGLSDVFLRIRYEGDVGRLYRGAQLLDDNFWNGLPWTVSLRQLGLFSSASGETLNLKILPLPRTSPMYLERSDQLHFGANGLAVGVEGVEVIPQYRLRLCAANGAPAAASTGNDGKGGCAP